MTTTKINQKEYLKRYLSGDKQDKDKKKKKKKKDKNGKSNVKIIDDDDYGHHFATQAGEAADAADLFALEDEAPQIVGIIDERPAELKAKEDFSTSKWKKLSADNSGGAAPASKFGGFRKVVERGRHDSDSDQSPPRKQRRDSDASPPRRRQERDSSPPRRQEKSSRRRDSDASPPRRRQERDSSPPRRREGREGRRRDSDASPPRRPERARDESPPRRARKDYDSDQSPSRRKRDARSRKDSDESPPRRSQKERSRRDSDESPPIRREKDQHRSRKQSDSDQSPPRRRGKEDSRKDRRRKSSDSDESPPRRQKSDQGRSRIKQERAPSPAPSRASVFSLSRVKQEPIDSDESPPRQQRRRSPDDSDQSPPRRIKRERDDSPPPRVKREQRDSSPEAGPSSSSSSRGGRMTKTLDGKRAGLQDARALKEESQKYRQRENEAYDKMSAEVSGRYAKTVVRERHGKRKDVEEELRKEFEKRKRDEKKKEVYTRWGKGVKQVEDYKARLEEAAHEMSKPLARYADDEDLDEHLKQQERVGDPMLEYIRSKKKEKDRQEGRLQKPVYKGSFPDNRFGIRPGYRWDGVDRSNGFEKKWFEMTSKKKAGEEEAYKYSVEDM